MAQNGGIIKIAVVGAESTGKTWLCEALAKHFSTVWVPEYAREYFNDSDIYNYTLEDLTVIAEKQIEMENQLLLKARRFLFCDTAPVTLKIWAELEFRSVPGIILEQIKDVRYDYYFVTNNDVPWTADPLRQNKHSRDLLFRLNLDEVERTGTARSVISGVNDQRLAKAIQIINRAFGPPDSNTP